MAKGPRGEEHAQPTCWSEAGASLVLVTCTLKGLEQPPHSERAVRRNPSNKPVETTESGIHDVAVRMRRMGAPGRLGRRRVHTAATGQGDVSPRMGDRTDKPVPEQLRTAAGKGENMKARKVALPAPANGIWPAATALTTELIGACRTLEHNEWYLGGGTMLAADWQHRTSTDIDILIAPGLSMNALPDAAARRIERLIKQEQGETIRSPDQKLSVSYPGRGKIGRSGGGESEQHAPEYPTRDRRPSSGNPATAASGYIESGIAC